jgi:hypothetical protein
VTLLDIFCQYLSYQCYHKWFNVGIVYLNCIVANIVHLFPSTCQNDGPLLSTVRLEKKAKASLIDDTLDLQHSYS